MGVGHPLHAAELFIGLEDGAEAAGGGGGNGGGGWGSPAPSFRTVGQLIATTPTIPTIPIFLLHFASTHASCAPGPSGKGRHAPDTQEGTVSNGPQRPLNEQAGLGNRPVYAYGGRDEGKGREGERRGDNGCSGTSCSNPFSALEKNPGRARSSASRRSISRRCPRGPTPTLPHPPGGVCTRMNGAFVLGPSAQTRTKVL